MDYDICEISDAPKNNSRKTIVFIYNAKTDYIDKGGFGKVFKVQIKKDTNSENDPYFALKQFDTGELMKKENKIQIPRILNEIKIHRMLKHKYICQFIHSFENQKTINIILEHCENGTLYSLLEKRGLLKEVEVRYMMYQLAQALLYLKRKKIVHRDIKVDNIFLDKDYTVKLGDFGLAIEEDEEKQELWGTQGYYAPECGYFKFTSKSDVFAFGVCIYRCLTGKNLINSPQSTTEEIKKTTYNFDRNIKLSKQARDLLRRMLALEEKDRIDIEEILDHDFFYNVDSIAEDVKKLKFPEKKNDDSRDSFKENQESNTKEKEEYEKEERKFNEEIERIIKSGKIKYTDVASFNSEKEKEKIPDREKDKFIQNIINQKSKTSKKLPLKQYKTMSYELMKEKERKKVEFVDKIKGENLLKPHKDEEPHLKSKKNSGVFSEEIIQEESASSSCNNDENTKKSENSKKGLINRNSEVGIEPKKNKLEDKFDL